MRPSVMSLSGNVTDPEKIPKDYKGRCKEDQRDTKGLSYSGI